MELSPSPSVLIWRGRRGQHLLRCVVEQVGEECFALRLYWGKQVLVDESFEDVRPLMARVDQLRAQYA